MNSEFDALLPQGNRQDFLLNRLGKNLYHFKGEPSQYIRLLPWSTANDILAKHRLTPPRARLAFGGGNVRAEDYTIIRRERSGRSHRLLNLEAVSQYLRRGATLIIDAIDELHDPIRSLATEMERLFHEDVQVNAYIAWGTTPGLPLHEDPHDVIVLQVIGRKKWRITVPEVKKIFELEQRITTVGYRAVNGAWECILEQGDALYIRRGWRHEAVPLGEATIHLTAGIERRSGLDYLSWILTRVRDLAILSEAVPRFSGDAARRTCQNQIKDAFIGILDSLPLNRYFKDCDAALRIRSQINLPWSAHNSFSIECETIISWLLPIKMTDIRKDEKDIMTFEAGGQKLDIHISILPLLNYLEQVHSTGYGQLCTFAENYGIHKPEIVKLIDRLSLYGWISITAANH